MRQLIFSDINKPIVYKKSRFKDSLIDIAILETLKKYKHTSLDFYPFGSDERQFNSPNINIPYGAFMRVNYEGYKEYHTSLDNKKIMNFKNFEKNIEILKKTILLIDKCKFYKRNIASCEPFLSKRNLYISLSKYNHFSKIDKVIETIFWILAYSDGKTSDLEIMKKNNIEKKYYLEAYKILTKKNLLTLIK